GGQPKTHGSWHRHVRCGTAVIKRSRNRVAPFRNDSGFGTEGEIGKERCASRRRRAYHGQRTRILDDRLPRSVRYPMSMVRKGILYLSNQDVKKVLDLGRAIQITEQPLRDHSEGRVIWSAREDSEIKREHGGQSGVPACALTPEPVAGFRIRSIKAAGGSRDPSRPPEGPRRILILSDREGGEICAIMDEDWCHAVR